MLFSLKNTKTKLQILATPIGNLKETSNRFLEALTTCECILCEDTRIALKLVTKFNLKNKELICYQKFNEKKQLNLAIQKIKTKKTILISDAGYPCISDPGYLLINECYNNNIFIEVINGPSSLTHSLAVSGLNLDNFYFNGFLPSNKKQRIFKLNELIVINKKCPIVFFESVHR
ncbi:16S rRNA (cytidine(1402)-2'-O)-methyltransferase, partial [bacterium]|nr:16S rRNA (cytidine(1402)-2'-O)-methyltransferase [bacterium]